MLRGLQRVFPSLYFSLPSVALARLPPGYPVCPLIEGSPEGGQGHLLLCSKPLESGLASGKPQASSRVAEYRHRSTQVPASAGCLYGSRRRDRHPLPQRGRHHVHGAPPPDQMCHLCPEESHLLPLTLCSSSQL